MIKCIAIDMDGTLLSSTHTISKENEEAIKKAQQAGIEVVVATGRSYQEASFVLVEAGIICPIICVNGAEIRSKDAGILSSHPLNKDIAREAAARLIENDVYFEVYTNKGHFTADKDKAISIFIDIFMSANPDHDVDKVVASAHERFEKGVKTIKHYDVLFADEAIEIYKFLAFSLNPDLLAAARASLEQVNGLAVSSSGHENLELTSVDAQKGIALEAFVNEKGISLSETMAIGDNYNDTSMFRLVGRAVAMGNADFAVKAECDVVTLKNDESGVAKAILDVL